MDFFAKALLDWYDKSGRKDLPWQHPRTPYRVWLSEIMLQQTQVTTVIPYFEKFLQHFPNLQSLANAELDQVLQLWSGLGYYARARNLHAAARKLCDEFSGEFPADQELLESLPGVGRSTAAAILAQAFGQRAVIMDGNVRRVLCRFHAVQQLPTSASAQKLLWQLADQHTPQARPADYTQAIMDLGATLCARKPQCERCPVASRCQARQLGIQQQLPVGKARGEKRVRQARMYLLMAGRELYLERRPPTGIWGGMLCPPLQYLDDVTTDQPGQVLPRRTHSFSHFDLHFEPVLIDADQSGQVDEVQAGNAIWYHLDQPPPGGFPAPVALLLEELRQQF